jgi:hypothetical protein
MAIGDAASSGGVRRTRRARVCALPAHSLVAPPAGVTGWMTRRAGREGGLTATPGHLDISAGDVFRAGG